jgi:hypothetical protein
MAGQTLSVKDVVRRRAHNHCEKCGALPPRNSPSIRRGSIHHRQPRRLGGPDTVSNLVLLCFECHQDIHQAEPLAALAGWLAWVDPEVTPLLHEVHGWVLLVPAGTVEPLAEPEALRLMEWVNGSAMHVEEVLA